MNRDEVIFELGAAGRGAKHLHSGLEIIHPLKGAVDYEVDGRSWRIGSGDIAVGNSGLVHSLSGCGPNIVFRVFVHDSFVERESGFSALVLACNSVLDAGHKPQAYYEFKRVVTQLMLAHYRPGPWRDLEEKTALLSTLSYLFTHFQESARPAPTATDSRIRTVKQYLAAHYKSEVSLQEAAAKAHISPHYLSRLFKKEEGAGFYEYLTELRLGAALADLLHTRDSILKVALANGFSNVASFNRTFFKMYSQTPARYRAMRRLTEGGGGPEELTGALGDGGDLVKFLRRYDLKVPADTGRAQNFTIDLKSASGPDFTAPAGIVRVGRICELLKTEVQRQIQVLQADLQADAVQVRVLGGDGMYPYQSAVYADYEYFQALDFLVARRLPPILEISLQGEAGPPKALERLKFFLQTLRERYGATELQKWRLEISGHQALKSAELADFGEALAKELGLIAPEMAWGLQFLDDNSSPLSALDAFCDVLGLLARRGAAPQFIAYYLRYNPAPELARDSDFGQFRHYCAKRLALLAERLPGNGPEILLMEWNTLSGFTALESNTFYRSALFMDEIVEMSGLAAGVAVWLNNYVHEAATGRESFDTPALFLFDILKRPVYFAISLLDMLKGSSVYRAESLLVMADADSGYTILLYNPTYFNPEYASDKSFAESQSRLFTLGLTGLEGEYIFERRHMDQGQSALYDRWAGMGFPPMLDQKVIAQLDRAVNMGYSIFEEKISGDFTLQFKLGFNEAVLFHIKRKRG